MRAATLFVDTAFYIAILMPSDSLYDQAVAIADRLRSRFVTTEYVFVELLAYAAGRGTRTRSEAIGLIADVRADPTTEVIWQDVELFDRALELYAVRSDKQYSLTDCVSMLVCKDMSIAAVLSSDHHFAQEGFDVLLK